MTHPVAKSRAGEIGIENAIRSGQEQTVSAVLFFRRRGFGTEQLAFLRQSLDPEIIHIAVFVPGFSQDDPDWSAIRTRIERNGHRNCLDSSFFPGRPELFQRTEPVVIGNKRIPLLIEFLYSDLQLGGPLREGVQAELVLFSRGKADFRRDQLIRFRQVERR